ncbi:hypothetical protein [Hyphomonas johnsonii]|uniref:Uncharacterized protein n=1 Tax=Hyphomonas johnsonii MHS-2 TaxID=1280950 RepID=A0A059FT27_9PROT|nr:hypothetical protein [Hyphomonas johnsonii]KCZ93772.1 hypothetical protein HJO_00310 [Hyphomonas johnsonii MHS-2]
MSLTPPTAGAAALAALLENRDRFSRLADRDFANAAGLLVRKLMNSAGQATEDMIALREAVGHEIFETELKKLTAHQARLLARRLDKAVDDYEVSTAGAAAAHIRKVMAGETTAPQATAVEAEAETPAAGTEPTGTDDAPKNAYFGRKSFRAGN